MVERGVDSSLTLDVYDAASARQTAASGTLSVYAGSKAIVEGVAVSVGPPASYTLLGTATSGESLSDRWLAVWSLTIGGSPYVFRVPVYLVRRTLYPTITDTDLVDRHTDLADLRDANEASFERHRVAAWVTIQRELIKRGRRPQLLIDAWALAGLHIAQTLEYLFRDFALSLGDGRYAELEKTYGDLVEKEWSTLVLSYDADEDGRVDEGEKLPASPVTFINRPPRW